jgi:hypothetical protein
MTADLIKETPQVEVSDAAIMIDIVTGCALAQADQPQVVGISTGIFLASAKIGKIIEGNLHPSLTTRSCKSGSHCQNARPRPQR